MHGWLSQTVSCQETSPISQYTKNLGQFFCKNKLLCAEKCFHLDISSFKLWRSRNQTNYFIFVLIHGILVQQTGPSSFLKDDHTIHLFWWTNQQFPSAPCGELCLNPLTSVTRCWSQFELVGEDSVTKNSRKRSGLASHIWVTRVLLSK